MKKSLIVIVAALALSFTAAAQPKAVGLRVGVLDGISYEHYLGGDNFLEANIGAYGWSNGMNFFVDGIYNFMIARPDWTPRGEWGFYAGPGITLGTYRNGDANAFDVGIVGQVGLEYTFWFPLNLSLDLRPRWNFISNVFVPDFFFPCLSVRYAF